MLDPDLSSLGAIAVYAIVWGFLFAESGLLLGFLLPGDTILFGAGLLAAAPSSGINIVVLTAGAFVAAVAGNEFGYATGRRFGRSWLESRESGRAAAQLRRTESYYERYGWFSVVVARWIPWVRTFMPVVAGTAAMRRRAFTSATVVGALVWAVFLPVVGYYAYRFPVLRTIAFTIAGIFITVSLVGIGVLLVRDAVRRRSARDHGVDGAEDATTTDAPADETQEPDGEALDAAHGASADPHDEPDELGSTLSDSSGN